MHLMYTFSVVVFAACLCYVYVCTLEFNSSYAANSCVFVYVHAEVRDDELINAQRIFKASLTPVQEDYVE